MITTTFIILLFSQILFSVATDFSADAERVGGNVISEFSKPYQIFYNPAGMYGISDSELFFDYGMLYPNLSDGSKFANNTLGITKNFRGHIVGFGFNQFGLKDWYTKDTIVLSYAKEVKKILPKIVLGTRINFINESYVLDEYMKRNPVFLNSNSKTSLSLTFGGQYIKNDTVWGLVIENFNQPDVGFYTSETLPMEIKVGYKHSLGKLNFFANVGITNSVKLQNWFGLATEYSFILFKVLQFTPSFGINFGNDNYLMSYLGFLLGTEKFVLSYSIKIDPLSKIGFVVQNRLSFGYRFVGIPIEKQTVAKTEYDTIVLERENLISQIESLKAQIKSLQELKSSSQKQQGEQKPSKVEKQPQVVKPSEKPKEEKLPVSKEKEIVSQEPIVSPAEFPQSQEGIVSESEEEKIQPSTSQTEQMLLEKLQSLEQKLKEVEKKKVEPIKQPQITPVTTQQPPAQPKKRFHTVVAGDTLPKIAQKYYGDSSKWRVIYEANKDKIVRGQLLPGTVLEIP
jgi:LysM repeat protein